MQGANLPHGNRFRSNGARSSAARQGSLREHNLSLVLGCVLDAPEPVSRADVAAATGLTRATVSALVDLLVAAQMVAELQPLVTKRAGRPAVPLVGASGTIAGIGLEINVDYLGVRAVDLAGNVLAEDVVDGDFRQANRDEALGILTGVTVGLVEQLESRNVRVVGMCLALPGLVDRGAGPLRLAPNLGWRDTNLSELLVHPHFKRFGVSLGNEANLAARAEGRAMGGGPASFLYVSGEVGIGGAFTQAGEVFGGEHGWSGELGHTTIEPEGPQCICGAYGCLEQYAGKDAMLAVAGLDRDLPVQALISAVRNGDPKARGAVDRAGWALGIALANFVNLTDIRRIVLGGIYDPLAELLQAPIERQLTARVLSSPWAPAEIRRAAAGPRAAMTGAALVVLGRVVADPSAWGAAELTETE